MTTNVMIDLETMGTQVESVILSIGACTFDPENPGLHRTFYCEIQEDGQGNRTIDLQTVKWWMEQETKCPLEGTVTLHDALVNFFEWIYVLDKDVIVWSNGTDFDISILAHAAAQHNLQLPWKYNNVRDYRTLRKLFPQIVQKWVGPKHHALHDAKNEAVHCCDILQYIEGLSEAYDNDVRTD